MEFGKNEVLIGDEYILFGTFYQFLIAVVRNYSFHNSLTIIHVFSLSFVCYKSGRLSLASYNAEVWPGLRFLLECLWGESLPGSFTRLTVFCSLQLQKVGPYFLAGCPQSIVLSFQTLPTFPVSWLHSSIFKANKAWLNIYLTPFLSDPLHSQPHLSPLLLLHLSYRQRNISDLWAQMIRFGTFR